MDTGPAPSAPLFALRNTTNIPHMPLSYTGSTATNDTVSNHSSPLLIITLVIFLSSGLMFSASMIWLYFRRKASNSGNRNEQQRMHHHIISIPNSNEQQLDWLPVFTFSSITGTNTQLDCAVCLSKFEAKDHLKRLPCFHAFHVGCIDAWFKYNQTCPLCRSAINQADIISETNSFRMEIGTINPRLDFSESDSSYSLDSVEYVMDDTYDYLDRDSAESSETVDGYEANHGGIGVEINEYLSGV